MAKGIIWVRTSTEEQECETQKRHLTDKAIQGGIFRKEDLIYIGEKGASAIKMNELYQKEVNELLDTIKKDQEITTVFVWEVSRLARNEMAFYQMKNALIERHIQLICDVPSLKLLDDDGEVNTGAELSLNLLVTLAKQEMTIKKKRFSRGKQRLAEQGKYNGGAIPFGYTVDEDGYIVIDDGEGGEAHIVRRIFDMYESGKSYLTIARELSALGLQGRAVRHVNGITVSLVCQVLTNELLTGKPHKSKGASFVRTYKPIISEEQFQRCRIIASKNNTRLPKTKKIHYAHGILKCPLCGSGFTTGGDKGYYRCRDAYNFNKFINGYGDGVRCTNNTNISENVMDSLLWTIACSLETEFIMTKAKEKLEECQQRKLAIQEQIDAIPVKKARLEERRQRIYITFEKGGQREDVFLQRIRAVADEEKVLDKESAKLHEELSHIEALLAELTDRDGRGGMTPQDFRDRGRLLRDVSKITDDKERSRIIHKHIKLAFVENIDFTHAFKNHPEGKVVKARRITIYTYTSKELCFVFIPYDGKGGTMLARTPDWQLRLQAQNPNILSVPTYSPYQMMYLCRVKDRWKYGRRERERKAREEEQQRQWQAMADCGYIGMNEMMDASGKAYCTLYDAIHTGKLTGKKVCKKWFVLKSEFEEYLKRHAPKEIEQ